MNEKIFKAYDIRGVFPDEIDREAALAVGRAFARHVGGPSVVVGRDMRESGVELRESLIAGLRGEGVDVIDIGRVATPIVYYATRALSAAGGVMITASHNPAQYNGMKLCGRDAVPIGIESGLAEIRDVALELVAEPGPAARGQLEAQDVRADYYASLLEAFPERPERRVVIDAGNGIAGEAIEGLLERLPLRVTRLYFEPDGSIPNHEADPLKPENTADLRRAVVEQGADLGVALDGDGDRAVCVDERGEASPADLMTALLAEVVLEEGLLGAAAGASLIYDLRSSRVVAETIESHGAHAIRSRVGHAFMKARMREHGACFGGELSGHYYFRFPVGYVADDAAAAVMLLLQALALREGPLSELWRPYRRYAQSGEINSRVADVGATLERVRKAFPDGEADELDGMTIRYPDWWFNLRPSNTEPLLRLNLEAATEAEVAQRRDHLLALIRD
jgi:phosphomannomutase